MKTDRSPIVLTEILLALMLLTRLPMPRLPHAAFDNSARAVWAYPIVGAFVGAIGGAFMIALSTGGMPDAIAAGGGIIAMLVITGALHEDGLADTTDGLWGGQSPERRLEIMRDSQIGSYGTLALITGIGMRWLAYAALLPLGVVPMIVAAILSRGYLPLMMVFLPNARKTGLSHSVGRPTKTAAACAVIIAITSAGYLMGVPVIYALVVSGCIVVCLAGIAMSKINGQTGDILGSTQQVSELAILLTFVSVLA